MSNYLQNVDFSGHSLNIRLVFYFVFFKDLDCDLLPSENVSSKSDFTECSLTQRPTSHVQIQFTFQQHSAQSSCLLVVVVSFVAQ